MKSLFKIALLIAGTSSHAMKMSEADLKEVVNASVSLPSYFKVNHLSKVSKVLNDLAHEKNIRHASATEQFAWWVTSQKLSYWVYESARSYTDWVFFDRISWDEKQNISFIKAAEAADEAFAFSNKETEHKEFRDVIIGAIKATMSNVADDDSNLDDEFEKLQFVAYKENGNYGEHIAQRVLFFFTQYYCEQRLLNEYKTIFNRIYEIVLSKLQTTTHPFQTGTIAEFYLAHFSHLAVDEMQFVAPGLLHLLPANSVVEAHKPLFSCASSPVAIENLKERTIAF